MEDSQIQGLKRLREPFEKSQISKLPKPTKRDNAKGKCSVCGGWHGLPAVHLDYVGHAALTDRLLEVDPLWDWEPVSLDAQGSPMLDQYGGMWIRLTVCGMTRLGYGDAQGKSGGDAVKERIGDALRNAAMRFGAALDLWHKGELHGPDASEPKNGEPIDEPKSKPPGKTNNFKFLKTMGTLKKQMAEEFGESGYYEILKRFGYGHSNQIQTRDDQIKVHEAIDGYLKSSKGGA